MTYITDWVKKEEAPQSFPKEFPEYSDITRILLWVRGLKDQNAIDEFFNPDYSSDLHNPLLLKDAPEAVSRIFEALAKNQKIVVYGDYDSDGVCGATILTEALKIIGFPKANLGIYLPDREKEGYGLKVGPVEEFIKEKYNLIITVDCGTTSHEAIDLAKRNGIDTVVIDHHRVIGEPPRCAAFVNAHQEGDGYPFKDLCGAAVAFKIVCALFQESKAKCGIPVFPHIDYAGKRESHMGCLVAPEGQEKWLLDLAAIATITDMMPLLGENRTIVKYGLFVLAQTRRVGLKALMDVAGVKPVIEEESLITNINPFTVGFVLGPRINAAGRMDHANSAFSLLNTKNYDEALSLAKQIDNSNRERQELVFNITRELEERFSDKNESYVIFEGDKSWPIGVVGIVAGRIVEKYHRPAFIYQIKNDGTCAGSIRTIKGFNVVRALESVKDILVNFGGHPQAGGFTVSGDRVEEMKKRIETLAKETLSEEDFVKRLEYDAELNFEDLSWQTHDEIQKFQPFGEGNREPVFLLKNVKILSVDVFSKSNRNNSRNSGGSGNGKKHLRIFVDIGGTRRKAMGFGIGDKGKDLKPGDSLDILFNFAIDEWNGTRDLMLKLVDFRLTE